jgi:hypothetical protein
MFMRIITIALLFIHLIFVPSVYSNTCGGYTDDLKVYITWQPYDEAWLYTWQANKMQKKQASFAGAYTKERTNVIKGPPDKRSESLPQDLVLPDKRFDAPFDISRNGEFLIAAIYNKSIVLLPSKKFAVIDMKRKQIIRMLEIDYYVRSLAWSPNGNYFAVLFAENVTKQTLKRFSFGDLIGGFLGHPTSYYTFHVAVYDAGGRLLCTERVIETIPVGMGYLEWSN